MSIVYNYKWFRFAGEGHTIACGADNASLAVVNHNSKSAFLWDGKWRKLPTTVQIKAIGRGVDGTVCCIATDDKIYDYTSGKWVVRPGLAVQISVLDKDTIYLVNSAGNLYISQPNQKWLCIQKGFRDVEVGADKSWGGVKTNGEIWFSKKGADPIKLTGASAKAIACGNESNLFILDTENSIWKYNFSTSTWEKCSGKGLDLSCDQLGGLAVIGTDKGIWCSGPRYKETDTTVSLKYRKIEGVPANICGIGAGSFGSMTACDQKNQVCYGFDGQKFVNIGTPGKSFAKGCDGSEWVVQTDRKVVHRANNYSPWEQHGGGERVMAISNSNALVLNQENGSLYKWDGTKYTQIATGEGKGKIWDADLAIDGAIIYNTQDGQIFFAPDGSNFTKLAGTATSVGVGSKDCVYVVNKNAGDGKVFKRDFAGNKWKTCSGLAWYVKVSYFGHVALVNKHGSLYISEYHWE